MRKSDLKDIILEAYAEVLSEQSVPTTMDELLARFPSLYRSVSNLLTKDYVLVDFDNDDDNDNNENDDDDLLNLSNNISKAYKGKPKQEGRQYIDFY